MVKVVILRSVQGEGVRQDGSKFIRRAVGRVKV
jgi:hypothetical protein